MIGKTRSGLLVFLCMSLGPHPQRLWAESSASLGLLPALVSSEPTIRGAWSTRAYVLKEGTEHTVKGHIFFTQKDWTVLFFVVDEKGPQRGSAEGGTYTLEGDKLVFTHLYVLASGKEMRGLPESPLRMEVRAAAGAPQEPCTIRIDGNKLRIAFPSGNAMTFEKSSGF